MNVTASLLFGIGIGMWIGRVVTKFAYEREKHITTSFETAAVQSVSAAVEDKS